MDELDALARALASDDALIGIEQARGLLGAHSTGTIERWIALGILSGRQEAGSEDWQIPLAEVLRLRGTHLALAEIGGYDLEDEELEILSMTRPGTFPWQREDPR